MWVKVSIAALVIALLGGAMYYLDNEEALTKERRECASRYKNLNGLRGEFTEEKTKYVDFLVKNEALTNDINALTKEKDELEVKNQELASANEAKKSDLQTQQTAWRNCNPRARIWKVSKPLLTESRGWKKSPSSWKWLSRRNRENMMPSLLKPNSLL